ncbi:MAG: hypothetical protein CMI56_00655 [Parcubacteria group bacterium]|nr:hypothetical protein [Parcubacteria group bacterium]|tara:strand:+ start:3938 stop:4258 length:321 start_codon:yes stop_codon:yes gene_type:complete
MLGVSSFILQFLFAAFAVAEDLDVDGFSKKMKDLGDELDLAEQLAAKAKIGQPERVGLPAWFSMLMFVVIFTLFGFLVYKVFKIVEAAEAPRVKKERRGKKGRKSS